MDLWYRITSPRNQVGEGRSFILDKFAIALADTLAQACGYVSKLGVPRDIVLTDGIRYYLYTAGQDFARVGHANLANLKVSAIRLFDRVRRG